MTRAKAPSKLLAEWFWIDRWTGSSAFLLPLEARGLYREMLTQAWRRGASLPNDHEAIRRACGATPKEWARTWPTVKRFWRVDGETLVNDTQIEVYAEAQAAVDRASERGRKGGLARAEKANLSRSLSSTQAEHKVKPPITDHRTETSSPSPRPPNARGRHPVFTGQRFVVFDWQLEDLMQILGKNAEAFRLDEWFYALDRKAVASDLVIPKRDGGQWLQQQTIAEARRRGLKVAGENDTGKDDPYAHFLTAYQCRQCGEIHEGTKAQAQRRECLKSATS